MVAGITRSPRIRCCGRQGREATSMGGSADYSVQGTTGRVTNEHGRKGDQRAWEGGGQTIVSIRIMSGNKRKPGSIFLTRLEKSDLSRDFFSCLDFDCDRKDFLEVFRFSLTIFCENGGRRSHLGWNLTENRLGAFLGPVGTSNSVVGCHMCLKTY